MVPSPGYGTSLTALMDSQHHHRFALLRYDGHWFRHPSAEQPLEWTPHLRDAHLWVSLDACRAAAFLHWQLRCEDVLPVEVLVTPTGERIQATYFTAGTPA